MQAIATVDNRWAVSYKNKPFASIPAEKKTMMQEIKGKTIIYDLDYVNELPGQQPVVGCRNIIFSGPLGKPVRGAECYKTLEEIEAAIENEQEDLVYIIHGTDIYSFFKDKINIYHITKIDYEYHADAFIDNLDKNPNFTITADSDEQYCFDIIYSFLRYERK